MSVNKKLSPKEYEEQIEECLTYLNSTGSIKGNKRLAETCESLRKEYEELYPNEYKKWLERYKKQRETEHKRLQMEQKRKEDEGIKILKSEEYIKGIKLLTVSPERILYLSRSEDLVNAAVNEHVSKGFGGAEDIDCSCLKDNSNEVLNLITRFKESSSLLAQLANMKHQKGLEEFSYEPFCLSIMRNIADINEETWRRLVYRFIHGTITLPDYLVATVRSMEEYESLPSALKKLFKLVDLDEVREAENSSTNRLSKPIQSRPDKVKDTTKKTIIEFFDKKQTIKIDGTEYEFGNKERMYKMLKKLNEEFDAYVIDDDIADYIGLDFEKDDIESILTKTKSELKKILIKHNFLIARKDKGIGIDGAYRLKHSDQRK